MPNVHITGRRYTATREALKPHTIWTRQIADDSEVSIQAPQGESIKRTRPEQAL